MSTVTVEELERAGSEWVDRAARGEIVVVTRDGTPVAELRSVGRQPKPMAEIVREWSQLEPIDPQRFREDIDSLFDTSL
jgi:antitoxin (DNA-binding transcriptional repressor) of toxin-antitoxin stability system